MESPEPRPFRWRAEAPWLLLPTLIAVAVRLPIIRNIVEVSHGDTAIVWLMMRRIATGADFPLLYYGQWYMGAIDPLMAAPFSAAMGPEWHALAVAQTAIFALIALPLAYRLLHLIAGRVGAVVGCSMIAFGTPWFQICTAGRYTGYLSTFWMGALFLLVGWRELRAREAGEGASRWRAALLGFLAGLGFYNNPQIALFVAPLAIALWLQHGRVPALRAQGQLVPTLGAVRSRLLGYSGGLLLALLAVAALLCFKVNEAQRLTHKGVPAEDVVVRLTAGPLVLSVGTPRLTYFGFVKDGPVDPEAEKVIGLGSPENYPPRLIVLIGLLVLLAEYLLAEDRRRWRGWLIAFGACAVVGYAPMVVAKLTLDEGKQQWRTAPLKMNPAVMEERLHKLEGFAGMVWLGDGNWDFATMPPRYLYDADANVPADGSPVLRAIVFNLRRLAVVLWAGLLLAWLINGAGRWWRAVRLMPTRFEMLDLLVLQQAMLALLFLMHPSWAAGRYWVYGWLMLGGLVGWGASALWSRRRALALALPLLLLTHYAVVYAVFVAYPLTGLMRRMPSEQAVIDRLEAEGLDAGISDYELTYHLLYRTEERMTVVTKRGHNERLQANNAALRKLIREGVHNDGHRVLFRLVSDQVSGDAYPTDDVSTREFLGARRERGPRLLRRWSIGPYVVYVYAERSSGFR